jgi:maltose alpha-D-glucosyltransferase/alpha-amylase
MPAEFDSTQWFKDAIIYELPLKSFYDSNQDGIGDFRGAIQKLDYLQEIGITAIWLLPFFPSPLRDDGYDIADYYSINPIYGNMDDFNEFLKEAHKRGLKVIMELVINHTSDQHPWFQRARAAEPGSSHRNYYVWSYAEDKYNEVRIIFKDFEKSNWTWDEEVGQFFWHRFYSHQPDLNFDNPDVQREIFDVLDFWASKGVDGFRLDAIPYLYEREGTSGENLPETHAFLKKLRSILDEKYHGQIMFLAEANMWPEDSAGYFGDGDECHMNFHFPLMPRLYMSLRRQNRHDIVDILKATPPIPENCQWATFLRNHDELTLEMVTEENRQFMWEEYAPEKRARINLGIRKRLATLLDNDRRKIELMNVLLFSMPGTPVLYYGDEIGMGDNIWLNDRDGVRTPMQWTDEANAGFSEASPEELYLPVIESPLYHYKGVNVDAQRQQASSLFHWMRGIMDLYKKCPSLAHGSMTLLEPENERILAYVRETGDETILVVVNLSDRPQLAVLDAAPLIGRKPFELFGQLPFPEINEAEYTLTMNAYGYYWLRLD